MSIPNGDGVKYLEKLAHRKKAEFFVRLAIAATHLGPTAGMGLFEAFFYRTLAKLATNFFLKAAAAEVLTERRKMAEEACKHDMAGPDSKFCPGCGATLAADPEVESVIGRVVRKVLEDYDVKPKKTKPAAGGSDGKDKKTLAEKLGLPSGGKK
jgi:hypothetical protein